MIIIHNLFTHEDLIEEIKRFYKEFNTLPTPHFLDRIKGYPSRKTFVKYFGSIRNAVEQAGFEYDKKNIQQVFKDPKFDNRDYLVQIVYNYISDYDKVPTLRSLNDIHKKDLKNNYQKHFGSWNDCLNQLGLTLNSVVEYSDEELETAVREFVVKHKHTPSTRDFNATGRPSFWCYQHRFGSWNNAMKYYGYAPNSQDNRIILDDGEVCASGYEATISNWLRDNTVKYSRDIPYINFIDNYKGKMNCDYKIELQNGDVWYVEMAGFLRTYNYAKLNNIEKNYLYKIQYKKKLLKRQKCNFIIITVENFRNNPLNEILFFLNLPNDSKRN